MTRGLGKGLDSLIPEYYDEDFDSNGAQSLEDMLKEDEKPQETVIDESNVDDNEEPIDDEIDDVDDDDGQENQEEVLPHDTSSDKDSQEDNEDIEASEDVPGSEGSEEDLSDSHDVKKQENVAEVLDIVDKNPRITLWSSRSAAVFRYLRKTEPEFSISREASILIDEAVSKKYPEIWALFDDLK
jgi:hypothetical protein